MACLTVQSSLVSHAAGSALEHVRFVDEIPQRCRRLAPRREILLLITAACAELLSDDTEPNCQASSSLQLLTHPQWCCRSEQDFVQRVSMAVDSVLREYTESGAIESSEAYDLTHI